ncbi:hypothetical protein ELI_08225 [Erythrobacter litoralis HTCC2594]|uniref:ParB/Sulfiredoxin domain-containing protein n=2 Tax=Erythrobacter litoralis TaxID=39960 RepID=Q2N9A4_ERYLH|nr:hypothetical protein ELI_08225 [Erythrobacter litoralis HTCC2594]
MPEETRKRASVERAISGEWGVGQGRVDVSAEGIKKQREGVAMPSEVFQIPVNRIHLYEANPRHGEITDPEEIIEYLLEDEQVYELAKSIAQHKTNPLELLGVVEITEEGSSEPAYEVWEGNRRVCAVMLLNDPDLAPPKWRKRFRRLSDEVDPIDNIEGRSFDDHEELRFWMRNIHNGMQDGRGRKDWGPDEQHRDNPTRKNAIAFELLEMAETQGLISRSERKGKLTTLQRFVEKPTMREVLGVDDSDPENVTFRRSDADMAALLQVIVDDLLSGEINSRSNDSDIAKYAATIEEEADVGPLAEEDDATNPEPTPSPPPSPSPPPPRPRTSNKIKRSNDLVRVLDKLDAQKLIGLYSSLTKVSANTNTQIIAVGAWAFIESSAKLCGANKDTSFPSFFTRGKNGRMATYGIDHNEAGVIHEALTRLSSGGNTTKHHAKSGSFDHRQIISDMEVITPMLVLALQAQLED